MANGNFDLQGLLGDPGFNLGIGLLAASAPRPQGTASVGSRLGQAMQFADQRQRAALENQAMRQQLTAQSRRQQALADLPGLLNQQTIAQAPPTQVRSTDLLGLNVDIPGRKALVPSIETPEGQREAFGLASQIDPESATSRILERILPEPQRPTGTEATLQAVESRVGPLAPEQVMQIAGGGTTINVGTSKLDEPLSTSDLNRVRLPDGNPVPIGTTARQAREAGARIFTEAELKQQRDIGTALNTLNSLEQMALDPQTGVFLDNGGSPLTNNMLARLGNGLMNGLGSFFGTEASERRRIFNATAQGSISSLVRSMGESGALSDGDVQRALALIPSLGAAPTTEREARRQFEKLRQILSRGVEGLGGQEAVNTVELGGGVTMRFID